MIVALLIIIILCLIFGGRNIGLAILFVPIVAIAFKYPWPAIFLVIVLFTAYNIYKDYNKNIKGKKSQG